MTRVCTNKNEPIIFMRKFGFWNTTHGSTIYFDVVFCYIYSVFYIIANHPVILKDILTI